MRKQWLLSLHKVANDENWRDFLASFNTPDINQQWNEVNHTIQACQCINNDNGLLIARGQKTYAQLLQLLKGNTPSTELYTAKGNKQSTQAYSSVTKA